MIPVTPLRPFTRFLMTIGEIPTSYLISMTYEEQLLWLCNYLEKKVIPAIDNNAEAVKELQDLFVELKSYVDNYFENLDVQEEINNKLDEMATDGTLDEIINQEIFSELNERIDNLDSECEYHFIKTGDNTGDCIGIKTKNEFILVDLSKDTNSQDIISYLQANNITKINKIMISHFHYDHIGGADASGYIGLINSSYVDDSTELFVPTTPNWNLFVNDTSTPESDVVGRVTSMMNAVINATITRGLNINYMSTNDILVIDSIIFRFLNCSEAQYSNYYNVTQTFDGTHYCTLYNNFSMMIEVTNNNNTLLLTGDIENKGQEVNAPFIHRLITIKKIPHHSVNHEANDSFLYKTNGKINVYMNMADDTVNSGRYPDIISNLVHGNQVYSTGYNGSMKFKDNGHDIKAIENYNQKIYDNGNPVSGINYYGLNGIKNLNIASYNNVINENDDLDNYLTCGDYTCSTSAIASTLSNSPITNAPFKLTVEYLHDKERLIQTVTRSSIFLERYVRFYNGEWGYWQKIGTKEHIQCRTDGGGSLSGNDYQIIPIALQSSFANSNKLYLDSLTNRIYSRFGGVYKTEGFITLSNCDAGDLIQIGLFVDGTRVNRLDYYVERIGGTVCLPPWLVYLSANQYVDFRIFNATKGTLTYGSSNSFMLYEV